MASGPEFVGHEIAMTNPNGSVGWQGFAVAYSAEPTILLQTADGSRLSLPAAWAKHITPAEPGIYEDRVGGIWRFHVDGTYERFNTEIQFPADLQFYAPYRRLVPERISREAATDSEGENKHA